MLPVSVLKKIVRDLVELRRGVRQLYGPTRAGPPEVELGWERRVGSSSAISTCSRSSISLGGKPSLPWILLIAG